MSLLPLFDRSLLGRASRPALEFAGSGFTFGELEARSNRLAQLLRARGLKAGDRLAFFLQNRVEVIDRARWTPDQLAAAFANDADRAARALAREDASVGIRQDNVVHTKRAMVKRVRDLIDDPKAVAP